MSYLYALFIRNDSEEYPKHQRRGYIAGKPTTTFPLTYDPFIVCKIDPSILSDSDLTDDTIHLNFDKLQKPNKTEEYKDEEGDIHIRTLYDYFDPMGRSSKEEAPVITFDDVIRGGANG